MMRSDTQLDYAVFQLTPTRTRCELLVAAQGKTYKLASGLLKPFVAHLRAAEEQIAKGGYSIRLELPDHCLSAKWFTKGTMERFVRFVSTPEVLERVSTVETELSELEEAVRIQESNTSDETDVVEDSMAKMVPSPSSTRVKSTGSVNIERLAKPLDAAENATEGNTKQCLLRALDSRRLMLQKEQGMSFARAIAAGFSIEYMDDLVSFAECFGADRLREACLKFIALCKKRQESGLWQDDLDLAAVETARVMGGTGDIQGQLDETRRASFPIERMAPMGENISRNHTRRGSLDGLAAEHSQGASAMRPPGSMGDYSPSMWSKNGVEYRDAEAERRAGFIRAHPVMAAWPGHLGPLSPHEAMQHSSLYGFPSPGMPYPQHLGSPYMQSPYAENNGWQMHAPTYWPGNHSANAFGDGIPLGLQQTPPRVVVDRDGQGNNGTHLNHRSKNGDEEKDRDKPFNDGDMEPETRRSSQRSSSPRRRSVSPKRKGSSGSKRSGMVVIRNINYITPNSQDHHPDTENNDTDSSLTNSEDEQHGNGNGNLNAKTENGRARVHNFTGLSESKNRYSNELDTSFFMDRTKSPAATRDPAEAEFRMSPMSHKVYDNAEKRGQLMDNMLTLNERERTGRSREMHSEMLAEQGGQGNKRISASRDSFILPESRRSLTERDSRIIDADFELSGKSDQSFQQKDGDDSFIVYDRIVAREECNIDWRTPLNLDGEVPSSKNINADATKAVQRADEYFEPDDLFMIPERNKDTVNRSWNTPVDYDMQVLAGDAHHGQELESSMDPSVNEQECKELEVKSKENLKASGKGTKARAMRPAIVRPGKPNPLVEAQLRAEKLRAYKADLQKSKKEKEDEDRKRIEDLKRQRQERIASRSCANAGAIKSPSTNRTIRATPLNASRSSLSTIPRIMSTSSPGSGAPSFMSPRTRDLINTKSTRVTENVVSHSVPSLNELQRVSAKASPARASAGGTQQPQLKRNVKDKDSISVHKTNAHIEEKRGPLSLTTVIKKGTTLGKDTKIEGSAFVKSTRVPTVVNKQEKKPTISAGSTRPLTQEQTTSDMGKASGSTQTGRLMNTEGSKQAQKIELPVAEEHASMSAKESERHPSVSEEEKAYVKIRAPESSEKKITVTAVDVNHHLLEAKCGEHTTSEKYHTILEECSIVNAEQSEKKSESHIGSFHLLSLSTGHVVQSENNGDNEELNYHAPVARLSTDEKSSIEEKDDACRKLSGTDQYDPPYALMSSIDFDKDAEYKEANGLGKNTASYGTLEHPTSHISGHFGPAPYAPPTVSPVMTTSKNIPSLHEAIQQAQSAESDSITSKSRKKLVGDAGASQKTPKEHSAKGLKKLLLLGRKSSRSPLQRSSEWNPGSMASEEREDYDDDDDEEDPSLSKNKGKSNGMHVGGFRAKSPDGFSSEGKLLGPSQSETTPTKSSRSFFSLPTFRTKGEGKA